MTTSSTRATFVCLFLTFSSAAAIKTQSNNGFCLSWNPQFNIDSPITVLCNAVKAAELQTDWTQFNSA